MHARPNSTDLQQNKTVVHLPCNIFCMVSCYWCWRDVELCLYRKLFPCWTLSNWLSWTDPCPDLAWNVGKRYAVGNTVLKICSHQQANGEPIYSVNSAYNIIPSRKCPPLEVEITPQERHLPDANTKYSEKYINLTWYDFRSISHTRPYLSENSAHFRCTI